MMVLEAECTNLSGQNVPVDSSGLVPAAASCQ